MTWPTKTDFVDGDVLTASQVNNIGTNLNLFNPTSATAGQIPVADGAGSVAWGGAGGLTTITSATGATGSPISLSSIPSGYKALFLTFTNGDDLSLVRFNGSSSLAAYRGTVLSGAGTSQSNVAFETTHANISLYDDCAGVLQIWNYESNIIVWHFYGSSESPVSATDSATILSYGYFGPSYLPGGPLTSIEFTAGGTGIDYTLYGLA